MIAGIIRWAFAKPALVLVLVSAGAALGILSFQDLRRDVFPDLSAPVFNVIVQNPAIAAEELETAIAIPLEVALAGLPGVRRIRSTNQLGVSQVTVEFDPDADYYRSRQFVAERMAQVAPQLPEGTEPPLISSLTGRLNEIIEITISAEPGVADLMTLRDYAEFEVKNRLLAVPGVAAVERLGGYLRQFQVQLDPDRMSVRGVTLDEVLHALEGANVNAAGGFVRQGSMEWTVRAVGRAKNVDELRTTVAAVRALTPVLLGDVAQTRSLLAEGRPFHEALREASLGRVRPKVMTAATAILGLLPLLVLRLHGTEIERPLAVVVTGGLVTSTLFTLLALPAFYSFAHRLEEHLAQGHEKAP
jgi:cobalt-zinc-cadmium resistance protein CzcA